MNESKGSTTFTNLVWKFAERSCAQVVSIIVTIILARILTPEDYGIVSTILWVIWGVLISIYLNSKKQHGQGVQKCNCFLTVLLFLLI